MLDGEESLFNNHPYYYYYYNFFFFVFLKDKINLGFHMDFEHK